VILLTETSDLLYSLILIVVVATSQICPPRGALSQICPPRVALFKPFNMSPGAKIQKNDVCLRGSTHQSGTSEHVLIFPVYETEIFS
jgi:hypothetical protein